MILNDFVPLIARVFIISIFPSFSPLPVATVSRWINCSDMHLVKIVINIFILLRSSLMPSGLPMTKSSLSSSLNSSGGTFNSNSSLNSTPTADRYAALKDLDEQLREVKPPSVNGVASEPTGNLII